MYKPGTQLILNDLWAAAAAHKLGFEWAQWNHIYQEWENPEVATLGVCVRRGDDIFKADENSDYPPIFEEAKKWRITVTESGPNAAERFLPQVFDVVMLGENDAMRSIGEIDDGTYYSPCGDFWPLSEVKRIIERNGIPFPQFSEVIEP